MKELTALVAGPLARNMVRYLCGVLASIGVFAPDVATVFSEDPQLNRFFALVISGLAAVATENLYAVAKRKGWAT